MVFSSMSFLCVFLPLVFVLDWLARDVRLKNAILIVASLAFYAYGEPVLVGLLLASTLCNYGLGMAMGRAGGRAKRSLMLVATVANLGILGVFKYADMVVGTINALAGTSLPLPHIPLPLGISFYTFQALSYVIDVYHGDVAPQRNFAHVLLYISFFPPARGGTHRKVPRHRHPNS